MENFATMKKSQERIQRGLERIINDGCDLENMQDYFGYKNTENHIRKISLEKDETKDLTYNLQIESTRREINLCINNISRLPRDINNYIYSFLVKKNKIKYSIEFPLGYPFSGPKWTLTEYTINGKNKMDKVEPYNPFCGRDWSPVMYIEKQVLYYTTKLKWVH